MLALFIIVLLNINTYAAVGANDGSAFVTKAEFDALINTFNEQMDSYQSGLNAKIDGAIANYLAGLSSVSVSTKNIMTATWKRISCLNGTISPEFALPNINIFIGGGLCNNYNGTSFAKNYAQPLALRILYNSSTGTRKPLFIAENNERSIGKKYWGGVAEKYVETINISLGISAYSDRDMAGIEVDSPGEYKFQNATVFNTINGYESSVETKASIINPTIQWRGPGLSNYNNIDFPNKTGSFLASAVVDTYNDAGDTTSYDHIIQYDKASEWWLSNQSFTKTLMRHPSNTFKSSSLLNSATKISYIYNTSTYWNKNEYDSDMKIRAKSRYSISSPIFETTNDIILPSIGMLSSTTAAGSIYLTKDDIYYDDGGTTKKIESGTLEKGFPLLYAKKDATIKWLPKFPTGLSWSTAQNKWVTSSVTRAKLMLSIGEFTNKFESSNIIDGNSAAGKTTDGGLLCNINENTEITFKMPRDGVVYAKWVPDTGSYDSDYWIQPLDLTSCNTYQEITE